MNRKYRTFMYLITMIILTKERERLDKTVPFRFVGRLADRNTRLIGYALSGNGVMSCIEAGINLIDMEENITKYYYEQQNTKDISYQINMKKEVIDETIRIEKEKTKIMLSNAKSKHAHDLKVNKHRLEKDLRILKAKLETRALHSQSENELFLKKWDFINEIRKALNDTLKTIVKVMGECQENNVELTTILVLQEEYRETQFKYNKLVKQLS